MSGGVILFNKWILSHKEFKFPILLTTWHLIFATAMTQIMARTTTLLDGRKNVKMTGRVYTRAIAPIGFFFSLSLICSNQAYLYLSVSFIQMLKVGFLARLGNRGFGLIIAGYYTRRRSPGYLGPRTGEAQHEDPRQRLLHRRWYHARLLW